MQSGADVYGYNQQASPQPKRGDGFVTAFSIDFQNKGGVALAKVAQLISSIAGAGFALYGLFELLTVAMPEGGALRIFVYLTKAVAYIAFELFLPALNRTILEHAVSDKE